MPYEDGPETQASPSLIQRLELAEKNLIIQSDKIARLQEKLARLERVVGVSDVEKGSALRG